MLINLEIGQFNAVERVQFLQDAARLAPVWTSHPANKQILQRALDDNSDQNKIDVFKMSIYSHFIIFGIGKNDRIEIRTQESDNPKDMNMGCVYDNGVHIFTVGNIKSWDPENILIAAGHECVHAWQFEQEENPYYKRPNLSPSDLQSRLEKTDINSALASIKVINQSGLEKTTILINGVKTKVSASNYDVATAVFSTNEEAIKKYEFVACEREAYGYHNAALAHYCRSLGDAEKDCEKYMRDFAYFFEPDLNSEIIYR